MNSELYERKNMLLVCDSHLNPPWKPTVFAHYQISAGHSTSSLAEEGVLSKKNLLANLG